MTRLRIGLLSLEHTLPDSLLLRLHSRNCQVLELNKTAQIMGQLYQDPPDLMLVNLTELRPDVLQIIHDIKQDSYFSMMPIIGMVPADLFEQESLLALPLDDYIRIPISYTELFSRISLAIQRIRRILDNNPLTRLPGNTSIQRAIEQAIGREMAVCYLDINHFKPFNDTFGFARGDEVIRMVARITTNAIREKCENGFSGHIGGDDFVFIVPLRHAMAICQTVVNYFEQVVSDLFAEKEKTAGFYTVINRKGEEEAIPLLGIAIGIVPTKNAAITHPGKVAEIASDLKKQAKNSNKSKIVIGRRIKANKTTH